MSYAKYLYVSWWTLQEPDERFISTNLKQLQLSWDYFEFRCFARSPLGFGLFIAIRSEKGHPRYFMLTKFPDLVQTRNLKQFSWQTVRSWNKAQQLLEQERDEGKHDDRVDLSTKGMEDDFSGSRRGNQEASRGHSTSSSDSTMVMAMKATRAAAKKADDQSRRGRSIKSTRVDATTVDSNFTVVSTVLTELLAESRKIDFESLKQAFADLSQAALALEKGLREQQQATERLAASLDFLRQQPRTLKVPTPLTQRYRSLLRTAKACRAQGLSYRDFSRKVGLHRYPDPLKTRLKAFYRASFQQIIPPTSP